MIRLLFVRLVRNHIGVCNMARQKSVMYSSDLMFAASAAADRVNQGEYVKVNLNQYEIADADNIPVQQHKLPNKQLMIEFLAESHKIMDSDRERGNDIRTHFKALTFEILKGKVLNDFENKSMSLANGDEISDREIATVACLPLIFFKAQKRRDVDRRLRECKAEYVGDVGTKVKLSVEIVKATYSQNYGCYFISGITKENLSIFFATRVWEQHLAVGNTIIVTGKVKAHRDGFVSQLSYTKFQQI